MNGNVLAELPSGRRLKGEALRRLAAVLSSRLPSTWEVEARPPPAGGRVERDGIVDVRAPDGRRTLLVLEAKSRLEPKDVPAVVAQARRWVSGLQERDADANVSIVVASPFLSRRTRELLAREGVGYLDLTGNVRVAADDPPLYVEIPGSDTNPWAEARPRRSLRGAAAGRVVRALCDFRPPYGVQELAGRSETPIATVSRVIGFLESEALLTREHRGAVTDVRWADVIRRWVRDYSFTGSNRVSSYLEPRGLSALLAKLPTLSRRYAVTGSIAAADLAPVAASRVAMVFVDDPNEVASALNLRPAETGTNVLLAAPFDPVVYDRTRLRDALICATPSQVAADLRRGTGDLSPHWRR